LGVTADEQRWQLLVTAPQACAADCQQLVYLARQLQIGLGRDASRASHALASAQPVDAAYVARLQRSNTRNCSVTPWTCRLIHRGPRATGGATVDHRPPRQSGAALRPGVVKGKDVLNDLRHLLKLSNIG
jgi:hypothetical protein